MSATRKRKTVLSTKGQVILPKWLRESCGWEPGLQLTVEQTPEGVLLKPEQAAPLFPPTRMEEVFGMLRHDGPPVSVQDMKATAAAAAVDRYARSVKRGR